MGCCCGKNEVTPGDTPIKKRPSSTGYGHFKANVVDALYVMIHLFSFCQEKQITDSSKPNTGDTNNNLVEKKVYKPPPKRN